MLRKHVTQRRRDAPETDLKCDRYSACCWGAPRRTSEAGVMAADSPVPRWSISSTRKWLTAALIQADASAGRGPSCPGPPVHQWHGLRTRTHLCTTSTEQQRAGWSFTLCEAAPYHQ